MVKWLRIIKIYKFILIKLYSNLINNTKDFTSQKH